jgi:hypothetical protein
MLAFLPLGANKQGKQALEASKTNKQDIEDKIRRQDKRFASPFFASLQKSKR